MATARWFFQPQVPNSPYIMQEQLRQELWRVGPSTAWVDVTRADVPHLAVGYWHDLNFELEWVPRDYVILRANQYSKDLVRALSLQLGFRPHSETEPDGRSVVEWVLHPSRREAAGAPLAAPVAVETPEG